MSLNKQDILALDRAHLWHPFTQVKTTPMPIAIASAKGSKLYDYDGKEYLDLISSWWVNVHGHSHPRLVKALQEQVEKLSHVMFAGFTHEPAAALAKVLKQALPDQLTRIFFADSGSVAIESALKMAFQYYRNLGDDKRRKYISFKGGYHGDTVGAMSMGRGCGFFDTFEDILFEAILVDWPETWNNDSSIEEREAAALKDFKTQLEHTGDECVAVLIEPLMQGAAGMRLCRPTFLNAVMQLAKEHNVLVIFDEVLTGFGRTGKTFAMDYCELKPDIICVAKGLTGGTLPLSATITTEEIYNAFLGDEVMKAFIQGNSYNANPLACRAAVASTQMLLEDETQKNIQRIADQHKTFLDKLADHSKLHKQRQLGTMVAFDVNVDEAGYGSQLSKQLKHAFLDAGLLIRPLGPTIYLLPPYCITDVELDLAYDKILEVINQAVGA